MNISLIKNRIQKCIYCPFAVKEENERLWEEVASLFQSKTDLLPKELIDYIDKELGELSVFGGINITGRWATILGKLMNYSQTSKKDIKFQRDVFARKEKLEI